MGEEEAEKAWDDVMGEDACTCSGAPKVTLFGGILQTRKLCRVRRRLAWPMGAKQPGKLSGMDAEVATSDEYWW